jgi:hypothetical protein
VLRYIHAAIVAVVISCSQIIWVAMNRLFVRRVVKDSTLVVDNVTLFADVTILNQT